MFDLFASMVMKHAGRKQLFTESQQQKTDSPVELIEIILSHYPEVGPKEKEKKRTAQDDEPCTFPLKNKTQTV